MSDVTTADGLHCVHGQCQGPPRYDRPCDPRCYFQGSAISDLELLQRSLVAQTAQSEPHRAAMARINKLEAQLAALHDFLRAQGFVKDEDGTWATGKESLRVAQP